jgi:hypothetical protein
MNDKRSILLMGKPRLPPEPIPWHAGMLTGIYENDRIRSIRAGDVEILRMIFPAVRDPNWGTVEPEIRRYSMAGRAGSLRIAFEAEYRQRDIHFSARYTVAGSREGIRFVMRGRAGCSFRTNRIGLCVLHPLKECIGKTCRIVHPDGSATTGKFPRLISPHQPFKAIRSMHWEPAAGLHAELLFSGDIFETEDQRNWTDASFKTYCPPLEIPYPVKMPAGRIIEQAVELKVSGSPPKKSTSKIFFRISSRKIDFPCIGVCASTSQKRLDSRSISLLKKLRLDHYRVDIDLRKNKWRLDLGRERINARSIGAGLEIVLYIPDPHSPALQDCVKALADMKQEISRVIVFECGRKSADGVFLGRTVPLLRAALPGTPVGSGTDFYFAELNRGRIPPGFVDFLVFSINPQVHAFDHLSLTANLVAQRDAVLSAKKIACGKDIHVSPVTFKMRSNPDATGPEPAAEPGELPFQVDPRQMSLYGAAWTLGSIKALAESGAAGITFYETAGWRGLMQGDNPPPVPDRFHARNGDVFPMWQVFKWVMDFRKGKIIPLSASHPLSVDGMLMEAEEEKRIIIANFTLQPQKVHLPFTSRRITLLDEKAVRSFVRNPDALQAVAAKRKRMVLPPCAMACIDF